MQVLGRRSAAARRDLWPGLMALPACALAVHLFPENVSEAVSFTAICFAILQGLVQLSCFWSARVRGALRYYRLGSPLAADAVAVLATPPALEGAAELCPLEALTHNPFCTLGEARVPCFHLQRLLYVYVSLDDAWRRVPQPVGLTVAEYLSSSGLQTSSSVDRAVAVYGRNEYAMPVVSFGELYVEHALAPFAVFQWFCLLLWLLDDYWYYALLTLFMLAFMEVIVVKTRMRNLAEVRSMQPDPQSVWVFRGDKWRQMSSRDLLPGDVISVTRSADREAPLPCDLVLLSGTCIVNEAMLTGESVPQLKESVSERAPLDRISPETDKVHFLFAGTSVVQVTPADAPGLGPASGVTRLAPDAGCLGFVVGTGFNTAQGSLVRTILFSAERVTVGNSESYLFIAFLLCFAVVSAGYVWTHGLASGIMPRRKLMVKCALILTAVVPPELPMELSLAVNNSLLALQRRGISCTEPFRIPAAGKVDVCCFDKTGTLTLERLDVEGIAGLGVGSERAELTPARSAPDETLSVLASCHALAQLGAEVIGDPMEQAALAAIGWTLTKSGAQCARMQTRIVHHFHFSAELKRMATVALVSSTRGAFWRATVKGAPEVMHARFVDAPADYASLYLSYARRGARVVALGYRDLAVRSEHEARAVLRDEAESQLHFAGLLVMRAALKATAGEAIAEIQASSHRCMIVTGDALLTGVHVARELGIARLPVLALRSDGEAWVACEDSAAGALVRPVRETIDAPIDGFVEQYDVALSGDMMDMLALRDRAFFARLAPYVRVFARVSPEQKAVVLATLKASGLTTVMCGDGTNDVGALKQADVGLALMNAVADDDMQFHESASSSSSSATAASGAAGLADEASSSAKARARAAAAQRAGKGGRTRLSGANGSAPSGGGPVALEEPAIVKLGDASNASPFTTKRTSPLALCRVLQQGRCTLVATLQMYRILAINSLVNAYAMSVLFLDGVKLGDTQMTITGLLVAACFFFIAQSKPVDQLSSERPQTRVFSAYMMVSLLLQFFVHFAALLHVVGLAKTALNLGPADRVAVDVEAPFQPNLVNSVVYVLVTAMQVTTFAVNYKGRPFTSSMRENRGLLVCLCCMAVLVLVFCANVSTSLAAAAELVDWPSAAFGGHLFLVVVLDGLAAWCIETVCRLLFASTRPRLPI